MASQKSKFFQFDGSEKISDILNILPEGADILLSYGLGCVGCHFNISEKLKDGVLGHGFSQEDLKRILQDLNEAAYDLKIPADVLNPPEKSFKITPLALEKLYEFQRLEEALGWGLKIEIILEKNNLPPRYFLDFLENPEKEDKILNYQNLKVFVNRKGFSYLKNCILDYKEKEKEQGFVLLPQK